ncbi:hypothetical protein LZY01_21990 [Levilactobacillus zymae]|uniref:Uncharacterized protein n=1 Tax=Levilactobacillus zymae TaxID=267363 RepID=A0ABQ0WZ16_9LACO|nr:hypothetical protein [Levilactobacillus zymae]QFR62126.1 hypothetical protein LZ395_11540 [Levilactobacillus zymae]GEO73031.1 hypothetical protein LZY01_21990 [Levilactobacillus zymae]
MKTKLSALWLTICYANLTGLFAHFMTNLITDRWSGIALALRLLLIIAMGLSVVGTARHFLKLITPNRA